MRTDNDLKPAKNHPWEQAERSWEELGLSHINAWLHPCGIKYLFPQSLRAVSGGMLQKYKWQWLKSFVFYSQKIRQIERASLEQKKAFELERLRALIAYVSVNVPYYQDMFRRQHLSLDSFRSLKDLERIPPMSKDEFVRNYDKLLSRQYASPRCMGSCLKETTSGSTGRPMEFVVDKDAHFMKFAHAVVEYGRLGYRNTERIARLSSFSFVKDNDGIVYDYYIHDKPGGAGRWVKSSSCFNYGMAAFRSKLLDISTLPHDQHVRLEQLLLLKSFRPAMVIGSPSLLLLFAQLIKSGKVQPFHFRSFLAFFEPVSEIQRKMFKDVFGCRVYSLYSMREGAVMGHGCEHNYYRILTGSSLMEIVDDSGHLCQSGQKGAVLGTSLLHRAMPFIRYETGDMAEHSQQGCPECSFPDAFRLWGRGSEVLKIGGKVIFSATLSLLLADIKGMLGCQVKQTGEMELCAYVMKDGTLPDDMVAGDLRHCLQKVIFDNLKINVKFVSELKRGKTGKASLILRKDE